MIIIKSRLGVDRWFNDPWIDNMVLKSSFKCLFDLADNKMATMAKCTRLGGVRMVRRGGGGVCY